MTDNPTVARIQKEVDETQVVLFMKGTPMFPQCGFSAAVAQAPTQLGVKFKGKTRVQQHQMVYDALQDRMGTTLHALALQTSVPEDA